MQRPRILRSDLQSKKFELDLKRQKTALKPVGRASLGPLDVSGTSIRRSGNDTAHGFTDMIAATRRGITSLRGDLNASGGVSGGPANYARKSMDQWAYRTHNVVSSLQSAQMQSRYTGDVTRALYDNWRADHPQSQEHAERTFDRLDRLHQAQGISKVKVYEQGSKLSPSEMRRQRGSDAAMHAFAYRMNPENEPRKHRSGASSRLSLNIDVNEAPEMALNMVNVVRQRPDLVRQSKIMGPSNIGKRVDDAVVYLGVKRPDVNDGRIVDQALRKDIQGPTLRATPPGMEPLSKVSGYAEYLPKSSSSHGNNRGEFVEKAVRAKLGGDKRGMSALMGEALDRGGYDPYQPSRIRTSAHARLKNAMAARREAMGYDDD
ncbi:T3SS effector HopA1 family protein [Chitinimonas koreensis]|uniref:T3SS effector HopA1 family protein n=1 Tax=Chitinimonas koreensis TaxID=356302 RepID=UPI000415528C|nr:T3SS effector HopA1 family protein [Chitinimonas koreensis]QNM98549.1 hypothetical protein H9L41_10170 [Chitinimonas koreensis]